MKVDAWSVAAAAARRDLIRVNDDPAANGLLLLLSQEIQPGKQIAESLWALAGLHWTLRRAFTAAWQARGRVIISLTFKLHALLGQASAKNDVDLTSVFTIPKPYAEFLISLRHVPPWRAAALRWIDLYHQRLTMHRYSDSLLRRDQARLLFVLPLELLIKDEVGQEWPAINAILEIAAEDWLATWDLLHATDYSQRGWNRIELPHTNQMGGFFGLADEARPPTLEAISRTASELKNEAEARVINLQSDLIKVPWLLSIAAAVQNAAIALLAGIAINPNLSGAEAAKLLWRFTGPYRPTAGWVARIKDLLTSRG